MSYSVAEVMAQNAKFKQALDSGQITKAQYDQAMINQNRLLAQATLAENQTAKTQPPPTPIPISTPKEETLTPSVFYERPQIQAAIEAEQANPEVMSLLPSGAVITAYNKETKEVTYRSAEQEQAYQESTAFYVKQGYPEIAGKYAPIAVPSGYEIAAIAETQKGLEVSLKATGEPTKLDIVKQQIQNRERMEGFPRGGTAVPGLSNKSLSTFLNDTEKEQLKVWQSERITTSAISMASFFGAGIAAPLVGPSVAIQGTLLGIGVSQGFKSVETVIAGGELSKSLLTPQEALFAAETGLIFTGIGKGVMNTISAFAPAKIANIIVPTSLAEYSGKTVLAQAGINAGLGAGGSAILSGGDPTAIAKGAAFGGVFSLGVSGALKASAAVKNMFTSKPIGVYDAEYIVGKGTTVKAQVQKINSKLPALEDLGFSKVQNKVNIEETFRTNANVDSYLENIGITLKNPKVTSKSSVSYNDILGVVRPVREEYAYRNSFSANRPPSYERLQTAEDYVKAGTRPMTQLEEEAAVRIANSRRFLDPAEFAGAEKLVQPKIKTSELAVFGRKEVTVSVRSARRPAPKFNSWMNTTFFNKPARANRASKFSLPSATPAALTLGVTQPTKITLPKPASATNTFTLNTNVPSKPIKIPTPNITPNNIPIPNINPTPNPNRTPTPDPFPDPTPYPIPEPTPYSFPESSIPKMPKPPTFPTFSLGGGGGNSGFRMRRGSKTSSKKNPVKTYKQMLNTFGFNTNSKRGGKRKR